jgi:hypothetical protein
MMDMIAYIACFFWTSFVFIPQTLGRWIADVRYGFEDRLRELRKEAGEGQ